MIIVKIPGIRHGNAYARMAMVKGQFVYEWGNALAGDMSLGTPGFSSLGSRLVSLATAPNVFGKAGFLMGGRTLPTMTELTSGAKAAPTGVYPVNKLLTKPEDAEFATAQQAIASGEGVIFYQGGEYETDQWEDATNIMSSADYGDPLFLNGNARLTRDAGWILSGYIVAYFIQRLAAPQTGSGVILPTWGNFTPATAADGRAGGPIWYRLVSQ